MNVKVFALKINSIDTHMDQNAVSRRCTQPYCVFRIHDHFYRSITWCVNLTLGRHDRNTVTEYLLCKCRIFYFLNPNKLSGCKCTDFFRQNILPCLHSTCGRICLCDLLTACRFRRDLCRMFSVSCRRIRRGV